MKDINRRNIIASLAGLGLAGISGCTGGQEGGNVGNNGGAEYHVVSWNLPREIEIQEQFDFEVTVENIGGETGRYMRNLYVTRIDGFDQILGTLDLGEIKPGEKKDYLYKDFHFEYVGPRHLILGENGDTSPLVYAIPANRQLGEKFTMPNDLTVSVDKIKTQTGISYYHSGEIKYNPAKLYIFAYIYVTNNSNYDWENPVNHFALNYGDVSAGSVRIQYENPVYWTGSKMFSHDDLAEGDEREGWIAFRQPSENRLDSMNVSWQSQIQFATGIKVYWNEDES